MRYGDLIVLLALAAGPAAAQPPLEALPSILRLQLDQRPAWRVYKDAVAETRAEGSHSAAEAVRLNGVTTPERLDAMRKQLKAQAADFERQASATETFYAVLSPEQRLTFDQITRLPTPPSPMHLYPRQAGSGGLSPPGPQTLHAPPQGAVLPPPSP